MCWIWHSDNKAGGLKHELFQKLLLEASCQQVSHTNTHLFSQSDDNSVTLWRGEKERLAAVETDEGRMKRDEGGTLARKTEKGKQFLCVSRQFSVVQFLLLSSTGNNYKEGWLPGHLSLFSFLHASKCFLYISVWKMQQHKHRRISLWGPNNSSVILQV